MDKDNFYEDLDPDFDQSLGAFKTSNPTDNRYQRQFIRISKQRSEFKKTVELVLCVHGWKRPDKKEPMTLIILGVYLKCHAKNFRYQSVRIGLSFHEDDKADPSKAVEASPQVVAYAPFVREQRWNVTSSSNEDAHSYGASLGGGQFVTLDANAKKEASVSYTRKHFDKGTADRLYDENTGRVYGVEWYCEQNQLEQYGVEPHFHLAVLVDRKHDANNNPVTYSAIFDMKIEAGFAHDFRQEIRRLFRLRKPEDDPIYFDPSREEPQVHGLDGVGKKLLEKIKIDNLGELAEGEELSQLLNIPGMTFSGLEAMSPPS
ncbi:hypothetical protein PT974_00276 [Cladobotryum mycophilum]|uniref:Uncharacterized protein n=1 Tax=Cladobotryum mycophilum TaxID=491253 RepID=A0ABR0T1M3_9HYPO